MPVTACTVTFIFSDGDDDITESWQYIGASTIDPVIAPALKLLKVRNKLMAPGVSPRYVRLSLYGIFRDSEILDLNTLGSVGSPPDTYVNIEGQTVSLTPDQAKACVLVRMEQSSLIRRSLFMSGLPSGLLRVPAGLPPVVAYPAWLTNFKTWQNLITSGVWGFVAKTRGGGAPALTQIQQVIVDQGTGLVGLITNGQIPGSTTGGKVVVTGQLRTNPAYKPLNGTWYVYSIGTQGTPVQYVTYLRGTQGIDPLQLLKIGFCYVPDYTAYPFTVAEIRGLSTRKRGNRSLVGPGRKRSRHYL